MILLKVYPVGSYYWSNESKNPRDLFGGRWEQINGRFLFETKSGNSCGQTGGKETHKLTVNEIPNHSHSIETYARTLHGSWTISSGSGSSYRTLDYQDDSPYSGNNSTGGSQPHNNM